MPEIVVFRLVAPLASFGEIAVGERRGSEMRPTHSAITGLLAGALGLERVQAGHEALAASFLLACRTDHVGAPLADFHTMQAPPQRRGRRFATRAEELADRDDLGTVISRRDYYCDVAFTLQLWPPETASHAPQALVDALNRPVFAPFAGRRSCPLGAPVAARTVVAKTIVDGFNIYDVETKHHGKWAQTGKSPADEPTEIAFDEALSGAAAGLAGRRKVLRRDRLESRARYQFSTRHEVVAALPRGEPA